MSPIRVLQFSLILSKWVAVHNRLKITIGKESSKPIEKTGLIELALSCGAHLD